MKERTFRVHPSDEELASYIDNQLNEERRVTLQKHIVQCQRCMRCVTEATKEKRKMIPVNSTKNFRIVVPLAVASLVIFFIPMFDEQTLTKSLEVSSKISLFDMVVEWVKSLLG